jgi:hypothetical protein
MPATIGLSVLASKSQQEKEDKLLARPMQFIPVLNDPRGAVNAAKGIVE